MKKIVSSLCFALLAGAAQAAPTAAVLELCDSHGLVRGAEIAMDNGCFGCHTLSSKRVGPAYREIAARYRKESVSPETLSRKIKRGGSGVWGTVAMPANAISEEESDVLARWILSL